MCVITSGNDVYSEWQTMLTRDMTRLGLDSGVRNTHRHGIECNTSWEQNAEIVTRRKESGNLRTC